MKEVKPFQSTRPIRGATLFLLRSRHSSDISIHAPHTERDPRFLAPLPPGSYFNPRAPYGARRWMQSLGFIYHSISIHAPHTGRDAEHRKKSEP